MRKIVTVVFIITGLLSAWTVTLYGHWEVLVFWFMCAILSFLNGLLAVLKGEDF